MKFSRLRVEVVSACLGSILISASALASEEKVTPYIGGDLQLRHMRFDESSLARSLEKSKYIQPNIYGGVKFLPNVGLELGYGRGSQNYVKHYTDPDMVFGQILGGDSTGSLKTETSIRGWHGNLVGFMPLSHTYRLEGFGFVGIARLKTTVNSVLSLPGIGSLDFLFTKKTWVPRVGMGLRHMINPHFGVKASVGLEKTARFARMPNIFDDAFSLSLKNSVISSFGVFYKF